MSEGRIPANGEAYGESIQKFQQLLRSGRVLNNPNPEYLSELQRRLAKVRCMGGAFETIGFSPDLEILLKKSGLVDKSRMATA